MWERSLKSSRLLLGSECEHQFLSQSGHRNEKYAGNRLRWSCNLCILCRTTALQIALKNKVTLQNATAKHSVTVAADYTTNFDSAHIAKPLPPEKRLMSGWAYWVYECILIFDTELNNSEGTNLYNPLTAGNSMATWISLSVINSNKTHLCAFGKFRPRESNQNSNATSTWNWNENLDMPHHTAT